jgi:nucleoside-diphosphate-sugar epimerase
MRVLVLGGTGFIGPYVVRRLEASGHTVTIAHTGRHEAELPATVRHIHDPALTRTNRHAWPKAAAALQRIEPEVVVDMAPMTEQDAQAAVSLFAGVAGRMVAISSVDVYRAYGRLLGTEPGPMDQVPLDEAAPVRARLYPFRGETPRPPDDPRRWQDDYDKILVERAVLGEPRLPGTVLRLPMVYGPGDGHRFHWLVKRLSDKRPAILMEEAQASWRWTKGYVENVADAIALAVTDGRPGGGIYNVGESETLTEAEWADLIGRIAGWEGEVLPVPRDLLPDHLWPKIDTRQDLEVSTARLRNDLGYREAVPRDEALRRTIAWEQANPPEHLDPAQFDYAAEDAVLEPLGWQRG